MLARSGLLDITMKTAELLRSNTQARQELVQLKLEIDEFTRSVDFESIGSSLGELIEN